MIQGQSDDTHIKQARYEKFLRLHLPMVKGVLKRHTWAFQRYFYVDLNAGSGYNNEVSVDGSPIILARVAKELNVPVYALLIERDEASANELRFRVARYQSSTHRYIVIAKDYNHCITDILSCNRGTGTKFGLVYSDPNGADTPFSHFSSFKDQWKNVDFLMNVNSTVRKRCRGGRNGGKLRFNPEFCKPLNEAILSIQKKKCFVTNPYGRHQWIQAYLTDYAPSGVPSGWFDIHTSKGQESLDKAAKTRQELASRVIVQTSLSF